MGHSAINSHPSRVSWPHTVPECGLRTRQKVNAVFNQGSSETEYLVGYLIAYCVTAVHLLLLHAVSAILLLLKYLGVFYLVKKF